MMSDSKGTQISLRIPLDALDAIDDLASTRFLHRATMLKAWIFERLQTETGKKVQL